MQTPRNLHRHPQVPDIHPIHHVVNSCHFAIGTDGHATAKAKTLQDEFRHKSSQTKDLHRCWDWDSIQCIVCDRIPTPVTGKVNTCTKEELQWPTQCRGACKIPRALDSPATQPQLPEWAGFRCLHKTVEIPARQTFPTVTLALYGHRIITIAASKWTENHTYSSIPKLEMI